MTAPVTIALRQLAGAEDLPLPAYASADAAGLDLLAARSVELAPGARALVPTGIAIAIPKGFEGQVRPRSGLSLRDGVTVLNAPGTIDADYRGEIGVILINHGALSVCLARGDRIAQLVIAPVQRARFQVVDDLSSTARDTKGFGSTGGVTQNQ